MVHFLCTSVLSALLLAAVIYYSEFFFQYIICEELGQGAYGTVYRAIEKATGKTWAAKMIQVSVAI